MIQLLIATVQFLHFTTTTFINLSFNFQYYTNTPAYFCPNLKENETRKKSFNKQPEREKKLNISCIQINDSSASIEIGTHTAPSPSTTGTDDNGNDDKADDGNAARAEVAKVSSAGGSDDSSCTAGDDGDGDGEAGSGLLLPANLRLLRRGGAVGGARRMSRVLPTLCERYRSLLSTKPLLAATDDDGGVGSGRLVEMGAERCGKAGGMRESATD